MKRLRFAAIGAALAYFFDPDNGKRRRKVTLDRLAGLFRRHGRSLARGATAEAYGLKPSEDSSVVHEAEKVPSRRERDIYCSSTLVKTMRFQRKTFSCYTLPPRGRSRARDGEQAQRTHRNAADGARRLGHEVPLRRAGRRHQGAVPRPARANL